MAKFLRCVSLAFMGIMTACGGGVSNPGAGKPGGAALQSIQVQAASPSFAAGVSDQFKATGTYSDGTTKDLTHSASWATSDSNIATIDAKGMAKGMAPGTVNVTATQSAISGSLTATVAPALLKSISLALGSSSVAIGGTDQITATGHFADGSTQNISNSVAWTVSNTAVASISASGLVTAATTGSTTITATLGGVSSTANLNVTNAALVSIAVTSLNGSVVAGATDQFSATGTYSDGSSHALTAGVKWTISSSTAATISNSGLVATKTPGTAIVTATQGSISGTANLTISAAALTSIAVSAASSSVAVGSTDQITAVGSYSDGSTQNLTNSVSWSVSNSGLASINSAGLLTANASGPETVTATSGAISGSATLTINASLASIAVTPAVQTIALATTQQFHAVGTYTDGSTQDLTASATWTSSQPANATVDATGPTGGLAHAVKAGNSTITAASGGVSGSASLTVSSANLTSIALTPLNSTLPLGVAEQFTAQGTFSDGSTQDVTSSVTWSTSSSSIASITVSGLVTAHNLGTATITATSTGGVAASTSVTVNAANLVSMTIQGNFTLAQGTSTKLNAIGLFNDGGTRDISVQATWTTSDSTVASLQLAGRVQSGTPGLAIVTATLGSHTATAFVTVSTAAIVSISVTPAISSTAVGTQKSLTATGSFNDGSTQVISNDVTWSSSDATVAPVVPGGRVSGAAPGTATISAAFPGSTVSGSTQFTVTPATIVSIALNPTSAILAPGTTQQFSAVATFSDGTTQSASSLVTWTTSDASVASINATGQVTGQSSGTATVTAAYGSLTATSAVVVETSGALTSITINPVAVTIPKQIMTGFTATGHFSDGSTQDLTSLVTWTSSKASVATISNGSTLRGFATGIAPGTSTISAWFNGGQVATSTLTVTNATLITLTVTPVSPSVMVGKTQSFIATATFSDNTTANVSNQAMWTSSDITKAVVSPQGAASGVSAGSTVIDATLNGVSDATTLTVQ